MIKFLCKLEENGKCGPGASYFVGAIQESPADAIWHREIFRHTPDPNRRTSHRLPRHCEGRSLVAISWYKGHPENRRDCHGLRPRNDSGGRWLVPFRGGLVVIAGVYCGTAIAVPYNRIRKNASCEAFFHQYSSKLNQVTTFSPYWKVRPSSSMRGRMLMPWLSTQGCIRSGW